MIRRQALTRSENLNRCQPLTRSETLIIPRTLNGPLTLMIPRTLVGSITLSSPEPVDWQARTIGELIVGSLSGRVVWAVSTLLYCVILKI